MKPTIEEINARNAEIMHDAKTLCAWAAKLGGRDYEVLDFLDSTRHYFKIRPRDRRTHDDHVLARLAAGAFPYDNISVIVRAEYERITPDADTLRVWPVVVVYAVLLDPEEFNEDDEEDEDYA